MRTIVWLFVAASSLGLAACDKKDTSSSPSSKPAVTSASAATSAAKAAPETPLKIERLDFPGTEEGAKSLLEGFLKEDADHEAMTKSLRPSAEDYAAIFVGDVAMKARTVYETKWNDGTYRVKPKEGQTKLLMWKATTEELRKGEGNSNKFPGGYKKVADKLKPGLTFYRFKFVKPEDKHGMAFDGLVFVRDHWVMVSKPYRAL